MARSNHKADHQAAWQDAVRPAFDQLSQFQYDAWTALRKDFPDIVLTTAGQNERFLIGTIPGTDVQVFVYLDQAEVKAGDFLFSGEHYDFDSPAELVDAFVAAAKQAGAA